MSGERKETSKFKGKKKNYFNFIRVTCGISEQKLMPMGVESKRTLDVIDLFSMRKFNN